MKWRLQGLKLFKARLYNAAMQCFERSSDAQCVTRCQAYEYADEASNLLSQADQKNSLASSHQISMLKKNEKK